MDNAESTDAKDQPQQFEKWMYSRCHFQTNAL